MEVQAQTTDNGAGSGQLKEMPGTYPHFSVAILLLYGMNTGLSKFTQTAGIQFPSALIGMQSCPITLEDGQCCALHHDDSAFLPQVSLVSTKFLPPQHPAVWTQPCIVMAEVFGPE